MRGGVTFDALGKPRELRFTTNAICRIEERTERDLLVVVQDTLDPGKRTLTYRLLIWGGLGDVTLEEAGDIMDDLGPGEVDRIVAEALRKAFPPKERADGGEGNAEATAG